MNDQLIGEGSLGPWLIDGNRLMRNIMAEVEHQRMGGHEEIAKSLECFAETLKSEFYSRMPEV